MLVANQARACDQASENIWKARIILNLSRLPGYRTRPQL